MSRWPSKAGGVCDPRVAESRDQGARESRNTAADGIPTRRGPMPLRHSLSRPVTHAGRLARVMTQIEPVPVTGDVVPSLLVPSSLRGTAAHPVRIPRVSAWLRLRKMVPQANLDIASALLYCLECQVKIEFRRRTRLPPGRVWVFHELPLRGIPDAPCPHDCARRASHARARRCCACRRGVTRPGRADREVQARHRAHQAPISKVSHLRLKFVTICNPSFISCVTESPN